MTSAEATAERADLEVGRTERIEIGVRGRPVLACIEHAVSLPGDAAFVAGWILDPRAALTEARIDVGGRSFEPLAEGSTTPRPDVVAGAATRLGRLARRLGEDTRPGFARHLAGCEPSAERLELVLAAGDDTRVLSAPLAADARAILAFARAVGWSGVAAHLPERADALPLAWRDALHRLMWLLPDGAPDAAELRRYLGRGSGPGGRRSDSALAPEVPTFEARAPGPSQAAPLSDEPGAADVATTIAGSDLFDAAYYVECHPDAGADGRSPLEHFCASGWREGHDPNPYFDTDWYAESNADVAQADCNPLWHYVVQGEAEGRWPHPLFDPDFYRRTSAVAPDGSPLRHYLARLAGGERPAPVEHFDVAFYLAENPDVAAVGGDPVRHYLVAGHREGRDPGPAFDTSYYRAKYLQGEPDVNPLAHYYQVGVHAGHHTAPGSHDLDEGIGAQVRVWVNPGEGYEELDPAIARGREPRAKALAFYLPQFHPIPENDEWWGKGFTEWRNVMRGLPRFAGHYQPRIPRDLGFYDLSDPGVLEQQVALARQAGLHGFWFHYYWFNGKRLLERPLDNFLADTSIEFPFAVAWANENWTRRWDGMESEVLMRQEYDERDDEALVDDLQRYFADPRYLRAGGRPLLLIYRVDIIPEPRRTFERWRELWERRHGERPLLLLAQTFGSNDPRDHGLDGAVEFPPHKLTQDRPTMNERVRVLDPAFRGKVYGYEEVARDALAEPYPGYPLIKTAVPAWDNDARRQGGGLVLQGSTPAAYERWLGGIVDHAERHPAFGERLVCINAWNEWAEAAYLEPDVHYGAAYLNATARALCGVSPAAASAAGAEPEVTAGAPPTAAEREREPAERRKVVLVGHDAHPFGAQINLRHMGEVIRRQFGFEVAFLLRSGGDLVAGYEELGEVWVTDDSPEATRNAIRELADRGFRQALANTTGSGGVVPYLKEAGFRVVALIHELPRLIDEYGLHEELERIRVESDHIVFAADRVRDAFLDAAAIPEGKVVVRPQGLYRRIEELPDARARIRAELGIPADARIVLNLGSGDFRKGIDIFLHVAKLASGSNLHFVWVGKLNDDSARWLAADLDAELASRVHLVPFTDDVDAYYNAADLLFLSSREDPYPSVVLEAMQLGLPVVALRDSGGIEELVARHGRLVDRNDPNGVLVAIDELSAPGGEEETAREARRRTIAEEFQYDDYCFELLRLLDPSLKKISVAVPSFNYREYLGERLRTVFGQSYPVFETLVLDDCSSDGSVAELERLRADGDRRFELVTNERNSGSAFRQWARACELARGDGLWIAEADDASDPAFLERLAERMADDVAFAFCDSVPVDQSGRPMSSDYKDYYREAAGELMDRDFVMDGEQFVRSCLAERNLVLNVSAVLWSRACLTEALARSLEELTAYKLAGDWHLYVEAGLSGRRVAYVAEPLNVHRRHHASVTGALDKRRHLDEVARVHELIAARLGRDEVLLERMSVYRAKLERQFGLARTEAAEA